MTFIVSLLVDPASQAAFDELRTCHFPPSRLVVGAHVTMFHALPEQPQVTDALAELSSSPFEVDISGVRSLGHGVALTLQSVKLLRLRSGLAACWVELLTRQDAQPWSPHVTVQNKVSAAEAGVLLAELTTQLPRPWTCQARGVGLWRYLGGPWEPVRDYAFSS